MTLLEPSPTTNINDRDPLAHWIKLDHEPVLGEWVKAACGYEFEWGGESGDEAMTCVVCEEFYYNDAWGPGDE